VFDSVPIEDFRHWPREVPRRKTRPLMYEGRQPLPPGTQPR